MISFIVSVYDRLPNLDILLPMLAAQPMPHEVIVCENGEPYTGDGMDCPETYFHRTCTWGAGASAYESANAVCERGIPRGEWLCFPSDDSLYVADCSKIMLETAEREKADLVYCDCVNKQGSVMGTWPPYSVLNVQPRIGLIDKSCFILKREKFTGFPPHPQDYRDGALIEKLVAEGIRGAKAPGVLVVRQ